LDDCRQRVGSPLLGRSLVAVARRLGERLDGRFQRGPADTVEDAREVEHAARLADGEEALLPVLLDLVVEAVGIQGIADVLLQPAQVLDRVLLRLPDPVLLIDELAQVFAEQMPELADHRRRLVADLARGQRPGDLGHRLQLLADPKPFRGRALRHRAGLHHPADRSAPAEQVVASLLAPMQDLAEDPLQAVEQT